MEQIQALGRTGTTTSPEGQYAPIALDPSGRALTRGDTYYSTVNGRTFIAKSATGGIAIIVAATTGGHPTIWNPLGSGRNLNIKRLTLSYVSGDNAPTSLAWHITEGAGAAPATGGIIATATRVAVVSAFAGGELDSKAYWSPTTNTFAAAPVYYRPVSLSLFTGVAATATAPFKMEEVYDGDLVIAPGTALSLCTQAATTTALFRVTIIGEEIDE